MHRKIPIMYWDHSYYSNPPPWLVGLCKRSSSTTPLRVGTQLGSQDLYETWLIHFLVEKWGGSGVRTSYPWEAMLHMSPSFSPSDWRIRYGFLYWRLDTVRWFSPHPFTHANINIFPGTLLMKYAICYTYSRTSSSLWYNYRRTRDSLSKSEEWLFQKQEQQKLPQRWSQDNTKGSNGMLKRDIW